MAQKVKATLLGKSNFNSVSEKAEECVEMIEIYSYTVILKEGRMVDYKAKHILKKNKLCFSSVEKEEQKSLLK